MHRLRELPWVKQESSPESSSPIYSKILPTSLRPSKCLPLGLSNTYAPTMVKSHILCYRKICSLNCTIADNCFALVLPSSGGSSEDTGLNQILALLRRSDTIAVKSEGTRVFVNVIRTLWSQVTPASEKRTASMNAITTPSVALALAQLIGRSKKYPILINEGMVALTLLSLHGRGGMLHLSSPCLREHH